MTRRPLALVVALGGLLTPFVAAQEPPAGPQKRPLDAFREIRDLINDGRFEVAAESIKDFLKLNPTDQDYIDIQSRYGPTAFLRLHNIPRWYDEEKRDAEFKAGPLTQLLEASQAATTKLLRDPQRIERYVQNLGASREEYLYAVQELRRSGDFVVPTMVATLRTDMTPEVRQGILSAIRELGAQTVPGFIAATDGLSDDLKIGILRAIASRPDVLALVGTADTDITPSLWYLASAPNGVSGVTRSAAELLRQVTGGVADTRQAAAELVQFAAPLYQRKGQFASLDKVRNRVTFWEWDPAAQKVKSNELTPAQAEERLGLKYLRWAIERKPGYEPAEELFLALATERAIERANFGSLAATDPAVYRVVVAAPAATLITLLETALAENRTALALGIIQVLGERAERTAATPASRTGPGGEAIAGRPAPLVRALSYPDPRVQFAAAAALLRIPHIATGANARVVETLGRAVAGDPAEGKESKGRALLADTRMSRADQVADILRGIGYETEQYGSGRDLLRRVRRASDFDLVLLDRHIADPELRDVLAHLTADANFARRPILVIASPDKPRPVGLEPLLLRLAILIAATETEDIAIPGPVVIDRRKSPDEIAEERRRNAEDRDRAFTSLFRARLGRIARIVEASGMVNNNQLKYRLDLRLPQLTYAGLMAEYSPPPATAPLLYQNYDKVTTQLLAQSDLDGAVENVNTDSLVKLILQLETALTPALRQRFDALRARVSPEGLGMRVESGRDAAAELALEGVVRKAPGAVVIPEPYSRVGFEQDIKSAVTDPAQLPRDPAEKKAVARAAVEWLRKLAVGDVPGYDVRPAGPALRKALASDDLADAAIDAVGRIPTTDAQQDLFKLATTKSRPAALRLKAADAVARHIQLFGKLTTPELIAQIPQAIADEPGADMKGRLETIRTLLAGSPGDLSTRIQQFQLPPLASPAAKPKAPASEPKKATPPDDQ